VIGKYWRAEECKTVADLHGIVLRSRRFGCSVPLILKDEVREANGAVNLSE
jgi:hypothetical protein